MAQRLTKQSTAGALCALAFSLAAVGCTTDESVELLVEPPDLSTVVRVGLRVWDTEMKLVADRWLEIGDGEDQVRFPWRVPLVPDGDARWFVAEVELYDASSCPIARALVTGRSGEAPPELDFVDTGMAGCAAAFVAPEGGPGDCSENAPCGSLEDTLGDLTEDGRPEVLYLRGNVEYVEPDGVRLAADAGSGEPSAPFVLRAWPGTGTPRIRTRGESVIRSCCNTDAAQHFVLDGLDLAGGIRFGVELNGSAATGGVVRHCVIHDNGLNEPGGPDGMNQALGRSDAAIIAFNESTDHVFEFNVLRDTGVRGPSSPVEIPGVGARVGNAAILRHNLVIGNAQDGLFVAGGRGDVVLERNVVCQNGASGISATRDAQAVHNSIVGNDGAGIKLEDESDSENNLIVSNTGAGVSDLDRSRGDWLHDNGDGGDDPDPFFLDADGCLLTLRPDSPARGARDGATPGAR